MSFHVLCLLLLCLLVCVVLHLLVCVVWHSLVRVVSHLLVRVVSHLLVCFVLLPGFGRFVPARKIILLSRARNLALSRSRSRSGFLLLCALFREFVVDLSSNGIRAQRSRKKTKSVQADQSVIFNRLRILKLNDAK